MWVVFLVGGIKFPNKSGSCEMSKCISTAQARTKCGSWSAALNFRMQVAPVKRPRAFRLRRLAQSVGRGFGRRY